MHPFCMEAGTPPPALDLGKRSAGSEPRNLPPHGQQAPRRGPGQRVGLPLQSCLKTSNNLSAGGGNVK